MNHSSMKSSETTQSLAPLIIPLLKGVMYQEENLPLWQGLLKEQAAVRDYVAVLGLELTLDEAEGYAFLRSHTSTDEESTTSDIPRLVARRQLSYPVSLLLALLRKKLAEFDASGDDTRLILSRDDIVEMLRIFLPLGSNEAKLVDQVDTTIKKIEELGFIRKLRGQSHMIEVRRILKAFIDAQWLSDFDQRLAQYQQQLATSEENTDA